ncbi:unnamed protein product [Urochloa humidicola]
METGGLPLAAQGRSPGTRYTGERRRRFLREASHRRTNEFRALQKELIRYLNDGVFGGGSDGVAAGGHACGHARAHQHHHPGLLGHPLGDPRVEAIIKLLNANVTPCLPLRGSITASGDLVPLSYIAGLITGRENSRAVAPDGTKVDAAKAFKLAGIKHDFFELQPRKG